MIVEMKKNDTSLIDMMESTFFCKGYLLNDFATNIFSKYFIYVEKSNIIGYVNYYELYERFEIANIFVLENYRNKKIGSQLLERVIETAIRNNASNITLEVKITNEWAIYLYKKKKFEKVAIRKGYYDGIDGLLMERKLM